MRCKSPVSKYGAKQSYYDHFAPSQEQSGQAIKKWKKLNITKFLKNPLKYTENVAYDCF